MFVKFFRGPRAGQTLEVESGPKFEASSGLPLFVNIDNTWYHLRWGDNPITPGYVADGQTPSNDPFYRTSPRTGWVRG